jgi:hypothetical protein
MAHLKAPPSRYRVEERGRHLVVIDTQSGQSITSTKQMPTGSRQSGSSMGSGMAAPMRTNAEGRDWTLRMAEAITEGRKDTRGRAVLKTSRFYDAAAPRYFALDNRQMQQLGAGGIAMMAIFVILFLCFVTLDFFIAIIVVVVAWQLGRPAVTAAMKGLIKQAEQVDQTALA